MNRSAYLTTAYAIKTAEKLSKAKIGVYGKENIPDRPIIFVINHFTRVETFILPYYIHSITGVPVWSLGHSEIFRGVLSKYWDMVGVVSTKDPQRDNLILRSLLTGEANWIIFPEGQMVKNKKIITGGQFMVSTPEGMRKPHTGAAYLALKSELLRKYLLSNEKKSDKTQRIWDELGVNGHEISKGQTLIVPVNLTYYPIRAMDNIAANIASRMIKDIPQRVMEELLIEGTMLFKGGDIDIRFGEPIEIDDFFDNSRVQSVLEEKHAGMAQLFALLKEEMFEYSELIMQKYMHGIYKLTTVNHDHLFATFLRLYPYNKLKKDDLCRRVYLAANDIYSSHTHGFNLHKSLVSSQLHLIADDSFGKVNNFIKLALETGVLEEKDGYFVRDRAKLSAPLSLHRGRIDNPVEVMANEVEPLKDFYAKIKKWAWQPDVLVRMLTVKQIFGDALDRYRADHEKFADERKSNSLQKPTLLPSYRFHTGVVLVHSYLSIPEEVLELAKLLRKSGYWVYLPRLRGHGTSSADLGTRTYRDWQIDVAEGYAMLSAICKRVVVGGFSVGGALAMDLAIRIPSVNAVFTIASPYSLKDYSEKFIPQPDRWHKLLSIMRKEDRSKQYMEFCSDNPHINYSKNPISGAHEIGRLLESLSGRLADVKQPVLILHAENDPVVTGNAAQKIYKNIGSKEKTLTILPLDQHIPLTAQATKMLGKKIVKFLRSHTVVCR